MTVETPRRKLTKAERAILARLGAAGGQQPPSLAASLGYAYETVRRLCAGLYARGLVGRQTNLYDNRHWTYFLAADGAEVLREGAE